MAYFSVQPHWWDSIDMNDAWHPQTLMPRQLGYKSIKFVTKITLVESLKGIGEGMGSNAAERGYARFNST